jgi:hypothetical protein
MKKINKKEVVTTARQVETNVQAFEETKQRGDQDRDMLLVLFQNTVKTNWKELHDKIKDKFGSSKKY